MFKLGDKVKCIDISDPNGYLKHHTQLPKVGEIYTVRRCYQWEDTWGVVLEEIKNPSVPIAILGGKVEVGFNVKRFRKVDDPLEFIVTEREEELLA